MSIESIFRRVYNRLWRPQYATLGKGAVIHSCGQISNPNRSVEDIVIGDNTHVQGLLFLLGHGGRIQIGRYSFVGENTRIWSGLHITIGDRVLISHNCNIFDNDLHPIDKIQRHEQYKAIITIGQPKNIYLREKPVIIEDDAWIGANVTVLKGVTIGEGAIIGANSLVTKDVEPNSIWAGNPAQFVRMV